MSNHNASDTCLIPKKRAHTDSDVSSQIDQQSNPAPARKRTRGNPSIVTHHEPSICPYPEPSVVVERRRVNPESLAKRLGPDLVRDMEAHIYPGNKDMPTFAVRKELQERYNIDRRHIYDYFHSRGLRVVKEDRHGNLLRAREKTDRSHFVKNSEKHMSRNAFVQNPATLRVPNILTDEPKSVRIPRVIEKLPPGKKQTLHTTKSYRPPLPDTTKIFTHRPRYQFLTSLDSSPDTYSSDENEDMSCLDNLPYDFSLDAKPVIEPMMELLDFPMVTVCAHSEGTSPAIASQTSDLCQPLNVRPLSPRAREAVYNRLKEDLGPPCGFQECVGTYQAFMRKQARWCLDPLFRSPLQDYKDDVIYSKTRGQEQDPPFSPADLSPVLGDGVDFRRWMLFGYAKSGSDEDTKSSLVPDGYTPLSGATPRKLSRSGGCSLRDQLASVGTATPGNYLQTFEDLFPEPIIQDEYYHPPEVMMSPVVRTQKADIAFNDHDQDIHFDEKKTTHSDKRDSAKQELSPLVSNDNITAPLPSYHLLQLSPRKAQLSPVPEIKFDVFRADSKITGSISHAKEPNTDNSPTANSVTRSRTRSSAFSRSQAIRMMFENERTATKSSVMRLNRARTSSAGGGI